METNWTGRLVVLALCTASVGTASAQQGSAAATAGDERRPAVQASPELLNLDALAQQGKVLLEKARAGNGSVGIQLAQYRGHYTMLTARTKSGGGEMHKHFADFLFVVDGDGTELTGGTMVDAKEGANGEVRGTRLEGGTSHILHKGDFLHIPAGTPHQAIEAPGQTITIYVIKVEEPPPAAETHSAETMKYLSAPPPVSPPPAKHDAGHQD